MSTAVQNNEAESSLVSGPAYLLIRRLQSLTGIMFGGYLLVHLFVNATIAQGGEHYQSQVNKIQELPFLEAIEWSAIFIPFLFHAFYGVWIAVNGRPNAVSYPFTKNIYYLLQRISAFAILLFVLFHVLSLKFHAFGNDLSFVPKEHALPSIARHMDQGWWLPFLVYPLGVVASAYHTANGFWTAAITWGLTVSSAAQKRFGYICAVLFVAMSVLGIVAVVGAKRVDPASIQAIPAAVAE